MTHKKRIHAVSELILTRHNRKSKHKSFHTEGGNEAPLTLMPLTFFSSYQLLCNKSPQDSGASSNIQFIIFDSCSGVQISGRAWLDNSLAPGSINWGHLMVFSWHLGWAAESQIALLLDLLSKKGRLGLAEAAGRGPTRSVSSTSTAAQGSQRQEVQVASFFLKAWVWTGIAPLPLYICI